MHRSRLGTESFGSSRVVGNGLCTTFSLAFNLSRQDCVYVGRWYYVKGFAICSVVIESHFLALGISGVRPRKGSFYSQRFVDGPRCLFYCPTSAIGDLCLNHDAVGDRHFR